MYEVQPEAPMHGDVLEARLLRTLKHTYTTVFSSLVRRYVPGHLTPQQIFVLGQLCKAPTQPSELARLQHVGMSAVTGMIDGLVARGLVERKQDPRDRRAVCLAATAEGRAMMAEAQTSLLEAVRQLLAPLTPEQRERLDLALADLDFVLEDAAAVMGEHALERTRN
jgi:DNA-binding MarR family transcriptional regulator